MRPTLVDGATRIMISPKGMEDECSDLHIRDEQDPIWGNRMLSAWVPTMEEREAIASGAPICLAIVGPRDRSHPVVGLFVGGWTRPPVDPSAESGV